MAKSKSTPAIKPKTVLIKPREVFKNELLERIAIGEEIFNRNIATMELLPQLNKDAAGWHDYNEELIKRAFNNQDNEYFLEYSDLNRLYGLFDSTRGINTNTAQYRVQHSKGRVDNWLIWLKRLVEKLPLIEEEGGIRQYQVKERLSLPTD